jgi:CheY-like chemotaxis protein
MSIQVSTSPDGYAQGPGKKGRKHILCIDDNLDTVEILGLSLGSAGYRVTTAVDIADALILVNNLVFDLIVLDGAFPDGDGFYACAEIRKHTPETPIVFLSALAFKSDIEAGIAAGAKAYLVKPVELDVLQKTIARFVR